MCEFVMRVRIALVAGCVACLDAIINTVGSFPCVQVKREGVCPALRDSLRRAKSFCTCCCLICLQLYSVRQRGISSAGLCQGQNLHAMSFVLMVYVDTYIAVTLHLVLGIIEEMIYCNMGWWGAFILIPKGAADKVILDFVS